MLLPLHKLFIDYMHIRSYLCSQYGRICTKRMVVMQVFICASSIAQFLCRFWKHHAWNQSSFYFMPIKYNNIKKNYPFLLSIIPGLPFYLVDDIVLLIMSSLPFPSLSPSLSLFYIWLYSYVFKSLDPSYHIQEGQCYPQSNVNCHLSLCVIFLWTLFSQHIQS